MYMIVQIILVLRNKKRSTRITMTHLMVVIIHRHPKVPGDMLEDTKHIVYLDLHL
jgi:hypothetical protein